MSRSSSRNARLPELLSRLRRTNARIVRAKLASVELQERVLFALTDGQHAENPALHFALLTAEGAHNPTVIAEYYRLCELPYSHAGKRVLVVQQGVHQTEQGALTLRNIYLALLRADVVRFDMKAETFDLPIQLGYILYRDLLLPEYVIGASSFVEESWITVGPLANEYSADAPTTPDKDGTIGVAYQSACAIEVFPWDKVALKDEYEIDESMLKLLTTQWIRKNN